MRYETGNGSVNVLRWFPKAYEGFGTRLRAARESKGLTQPELAELVGTAEARISRYENGRIEPKLVMASALALALGLSLDELVYGFVVKAYGSPR